MVLVTYIDFSGEKRTLDAPEGISLMQAALNNDVKGIFAECGGQAECATCHVYVEPGFEAVLPAVGANEDEMLDATAAEREPGSRLACQIPLTPTVSGLTVRLPEYQR